MTDDTTADTTEVSNPYQIGDPVMDAAQGRAMVVVRAADETVREWSERENYELTDNYANAKFGASDAEAVVECVYVSDVRSEPSKTYTFPASRLRLIDAHHADDGLRIAERVRLNVLEALFTAARSESDALDATDVAHLADHAGIDHDLINIASDLARAETQVTAGE